jgi:hypothetical protein
MYVSPSVIKQLKEYERELQHLKSLPIKRPNHLLRIKWLENEIKTLKMF